MIQLQHGRVTLALHERNSSATGTPVLLLHELYSSSAGWGETAATWNGPVFALDFCGHGHSAPLKGGAYFPELLAGDADVALQHIGQPIAVAGSGIGAYIAFLLACGRPEQVGAALLLPGRGLAGGGAQPNYDTSKTWLPSHLPATSDADCDPPVVFLEHDIRPPDYVARLAPAAPALLLADDGSTPPPWWQELEKSSSATTVSGDAQRGFEHLGAALE